MPTATRTRFVLVSPIHVHDPVFVYTVEGLDVVQWTRPLFDGDKATTRVVFQAMDVQQAHAVAQALHRHATSRYGSYDTSEQSYVVTYATLRCVPAARR